MSRTLVKTATAGWYIDAADPDGGKVRKLDGDQVITQAEFDQRQLDAEDAGTNGNAPLLAEDSEAVTARAVAEPTPQDTTVADTGKLLVGKTTVVACRWVPLENQGKQVKKLYAKDQRQVTLEQVQKAAGVTPCGHERIIKVQDAFQAKFCVQHQDENRKAIRREKARAKRKAAKA